MKISTFFALLASLFGKASTIHPKKTDCSLYEFRRICIGSVHQTILIRTANVNNPVFIFFHGGPGSPELPQAVKLSREIEMNFTIIIWDQRGCGKSYVKKQIDTSKNQIVSDAIELIQYIKKQFNKNKVSLIGHSWGTVICMNVIDLIPNDIEIYISIGQVVDFKRNEEISYYHLIDLVRDNNDTKSLSILTEIGPPINGLYKGNIKSLFKQRNILLKYGCIYYGKNNANEIVNYIFFAPEYTLLEKLRYRKNQIIAMQKNWNAELMETNFIVQMANIEIPVCFIIGDNDYNTPFELVTEYYNKIVAFQKKLVILRNCGHDPHVEETKLVSKAIVEYYDEIIEIKGQVTIASNGQRNCQSLCCSFDMLVYKPHISGRGVVLFYPRVETWVIIGPDSHQTLPKKETRESGFSFISRVSLIPSGSDGSSRLCLSVLVHSPRLRHLMGIEG